MIEYVRQFIGSRTEHPILVSLFLIGVGFLGLGYAVETTTGNGVASGFLTIYAGMATLLAILGYGVLIASMIVSRVRRQLGSIG